METTTHNQGAPSLTDDTASRTRRDFDTARRYITLYGVLAAAVLVAVAALAGSGQQTINTFMWVRAALLPVIAVLVHRTAVSAENGSRRSFERLSTLAAVMPVAIVGVDLIPGVCPLWYAALQAVCVLPVVRVAFLTRGSVLRAAFPKAPRADGR